MLTMSENGKTVDRSAARQSNVRGEFFIPVNTEITFTGGEEMRPSDRAACGYSFYVSASFNHGEERWQSVTRFMARPFRDDEAKKLEKTDLQKQFNQLHNAAEFMDLVKEKCEKNGGTWTIKSSEVVEALNRDFNTQQDRLMKYSVFSE